ncbi:MAG: hypothetical protein ACKOQU_00225 [Acidimicrobiaceae bacterium]
MNYTVNVPVREPTKRLSTTR